MGERVEQVGGVDSVERISHEGWLRKGRELFGGNMRDWKFVCPKCKTVQSVRDFEACDIGIHLTRRMLTYSCIGRETDKMGCDWTLGGLLQIHELEVIFEDGTIRPLFRFHE